MTMSSSEPATNRLRIKNASQVVLVCTNGERVLKGSAMQDIVTLEASGGKGLSVLVDGEGNIAAVGYEDQVDTTVPQGSYEQEIDATGMCVLPGLVDAHTHPVWVGDRVHEFAMKVGRVVLLWQPVWEIRCPAQQCCVAMATSCSLYTGS